MKKTRKQCQKCGKWFWRDSEFIGRCPACKKMQGDYSPSIYSVCLPLNNNLTMYSMSGRI